VRAWVSGRRILGRPLYMSERPQEFDALCAFFEVCATDGGQGALDQVFRSYAGGAWGYDPNDVLVAYQRVCRAKGWTEALP
jgi:hypothetical protein